MFAPLIIWPSTVRRAAPTRNFEYGEYENSLAKLVFTVSVLAQMEIDVATRVPSKQDWMSCSCCSTVKVKDLVGAAILSCTSRSVEDYLAL